MRRLGRFPFLKKVSLDIKIKGINDISTIIKGRSVFKN